MAPSTQASSVTEIAVLGSLLVRSRLDKTGSQMQLWISHDSIAPSDQARNSQTPLDQTRGFLM